MATTTISGVQYSGIWSLSGQANAKALGTWPVLPTNFLYAWGDNSAGALGIGNRTNYSSPKQVGSNTNWLQICAGGYQNTSAGVKTDGTLWTWGFNGQGQLGLGNITNYSSPKQVGSLTGWVQVSTGRFQNTAAVKSNGTLWLMGAGSYGQLGLGNTTSYSSPKQVGALTNWASAVCANGGVRALKTDGTIWTWGYNPAGQLGLNNRTYYSSPKQVGSLTTWAQINGVGNFTMAITTGGALYAWGSGSNGVLGLGNTTSYSSPKQVGSLTNWAYIAPQMYSTIALKTDGTLWAWGSNAYGQSGLGNQTNYSSPKQIGLLTTWLKIAGTYNSTYAITTSGALYAWGDNQFGQLGLGNTTAYSSPKQVGSLTTWTTLSTFGGNAQNILAIATT
jgi:hypothetical protein